MKNKHSEKLGAVGLALSIVASVSLIALFLLNCAGVYVASNIGVFWDAAILWGFRAIFAVLAVLAVRAAVTRQRFAKGHVALAIQVVTFTLLSSGLLQRRVEDWNFNSRLPRRAEVVELVRQGKLEPRLHGPCDCFYADLSSVYANVSAGREVLVSRHSGGFSVIFFVERAAMWSDDDYTAFVFRSDDSPPRTGDEDTDRFFDIRPVQQHWFFVRHT